jgi:hypothetical protein
VIFEIKPGESTPAQLAVPGPARLKMVDPLATMGPSSPCEVLHSSGSTLRLRVKRQMFQGSKVQVVTPARIMFGEVLSTVPKEGAYEIEVEVQRD